MLLATFALPAGSVKAPAATCNDALPNEPGVGTNVAEYNVPEPPKPVSDPPATVTDPAPKPVTVSETVKVTTDDWDAFSVPAPERTTETVGAVASRVTCVVDVFAEDGPGLPDKSRAPFAANAGTIVPSEQPETVTVREAPLPDTANEQPVAEPEFEKSAGSTPVTGSENVIVYTTDADDDTDDADTNDVTLGPEASPRRRTLRHSDPAAVRTHCNTSLPVVTMRPMMMHSSPSVLGVNDSGTDAFVGRQRKPLAVRSQRRLLNDVTTTRPSFEHVSPARRSTNADTGDSS